VTANKARFQRIFSLLISQKWLGSFEKEVHELFDECDSDDQVELISDLLHHFRFLDRGEEQDALNQIVNGIIDLGFSEGEVQIVATSANDDADSGQAVLYGLKPLFVKAGWSNVQLVNQFGKAQRYIPDKYVVCLVDEFVGTGRSIVGRLSAMRRDFKNNKHFQGARFFVFAYAGMIAAKDALLDSKLCEKVFFVHSLRKGISELLPDPQIKTPLMLALENKLEPVVSSFPLPSFGDGACEALYGREGGNCPNSVFPVFWWPMSSASGRRKTLLVRKM